MFPTFKDGTIDFEVMHYCDTLVNGFSESDMQWIRAFIKEFEMKEAKEEDE